MLKSQTIQLDQSKRRERMAEIQNSDEINDDGRAELRKLTDAYQGAEIELRAALTLESAERETIETPEKPDDFGRECRAFDVSRIVQAAEKGRPLDGREAEVTAELEKRQGGTTKGGVLLPWEALETRADNLTTTATAEGGNLAPAPIMSVLERFFETSAAARFGVRTLQVTGKPGFPEMVDGASIAWVGEGEGTDAAAIITTTRAPTIHTATARYLVSRQAVHQNPALQPILRRDLSEVIRAGVDRAVFQGSGLNNEPSGLDARLAGSAFDAKATFSALLARAVALWESAKLSGVEGIRMAAAPIVFQTLADQTATGETSQLDRVQKTFGGAVFSPNVSTWGARNTTAKGASTVYMAAGVDHAFVTAWGSPELIVDPYSESKTGKIALTVFTFLDFLAQRAGTHFVKLTGVQDR